MDSPARPPYSVLCSVNRRVDNWNVITPSSFPHEIDALDFVRTGLSPSSHAFANFTFVGLDGSLNEVDLLVVGPWGFFLCEIKSRPGTVRGDGQTWQWHDGSRIHSQDNPLILTQRKCQKLKALLERQKAFQKEREHPPFLEPLVFLSHPGNQIALPAEAAQRVFLRDSAKTPGIRAALNQRVGAGLKTFAHPPIPAPVLKATLRALHSIGLKTRSTAQHVGDYELSRLLYESPAHTVQDWEATHVSAKSVLILARLYLVNTAATAEDRAVLAKAARRDFELIAPLDHPGLLRVDTMVTTERGPVVIYRYPAAARRLDHFLSEKGDSLGVSDRLSILRQVAEAIAYAHEHRVIHRGLTPQSVLVSPVEGGGWRTHVYNWQLGSGQFTRTDGAGTRSLHATDLLEDASTAYLAPEAISGTHLDSPEIDTFSLGALAWRLFTDTPPATSSLDLAARLHDGGGYLDVASAKDGLPNSLRELIQSSTHVQASSRFSAREFAQLIDEIEDELTRPEPRHISNPREARPGDWLEGGLQVIRRLGSGSVSVVFLVAVPGEKEPLVLKLAAQPEYNDRLKSELETLRKLSHPSIVRPHEAFESGGIIGFLMDSAVEVPREWLASESADEPAATATRHRFSEAETLAVRLRRYGRLEIDLLQNFGDDLLKALEYIHECGLSHRDVKPDNIGLRLPRSKERVRLILFDFSLTSAPLEEIRVGTPPYLDPFLPLRKTKRWDSHAERFAAAMTLHEMAAGALPKWGDGRSTPHLIECEVTLQPELFAADLREGLTAFFSRALRRDPTKRFDTWEQMRAAWSEIFRHVDDPPVRPPTTDVPAPDSAALAEVATLDTLLAQLLSTRGVNALDRFGVHTVGDLLRYPLRSVYRMPGVGNKTRQEILGLVQALRKRFPSGAGAAPDLDAADGDDAAKNVEPESQNIDVIARQITVRRRGNQGSAENAALERFFGLTAGEESRPPGEWLSQSEAAPLLGVSRARVGQVVDKARERWLRVPALTSVRDEIERLLRAQAGVMRHHELIAAVLAARGSAFEEPERTRLASVVVRAAVEAERAKDARFLEVRRTDTIFIALARPLADWALDLAKAADSLLLGEGGTEALPSRARTIEALQQVERPLVEGLEACPPPDPTRLVTLATSLARVARANARLELYPADLPPERSLLLCRSSFFHTGPLAPEEIGRRVSARFPEAQPLPADREKLEALFAAAEVPLRWSPVAREGRGAFVSAVSAEALTGTEEASQRAATRPTFHPMPSVSEDIASAVLLEEKLQSSAARGSFLVLSVPPDRLARAERELLARFPVQHVDADRLFLRLLREAAARVGAAWSTVLAADAAPPDSVDGQNLRRLVSMIVPQLRATLVVPDRTVLLTHPGLFARYDLMRIIAELRDEIGRSAGPHGLWLLIPAIVDSTLPRLNGVPVPVISQNQHVTLPDPWLNNVHRGDQLPA